MLKELLKAVAGVLWSVGLQSLALRVLVATMDDATEKVVVPFVNVPKKHAQLVLDDKREKSTYEPTRELQEIKVVYVDKHALEELTLYNNDFAPLRSKLDMN